MTSLYVGLPCFGGLLYAPCARGLLALQSECVRLGIALQVDFALGESLIPRARNDIVARYLASGATHLFFLDADIDFSPAHVLGLLEAQKPVVCGAYPKKGIDWERVRAAVRQGRDPAACAAAYAINADLSAGTSTLEGDVVVPYTSDRGCVPILDAATGFLLLERQALLDMIARYPETRYRSDSPDTRGAPRWALFDCEIEPGTLRYLSEDYTFSRRWQRMGGTVWLYLGAHLGHVGSYTYRGDLLSIYEPQEAFRWPSGLDAGARRDLEAVLAGSYDVPVEGVRSVLDVGANIGAFAVWAAERWPGAEITCYEPHPDNMRLLEHNAPRARREPSAVRSSRRQAILLEGRDNQGCASFRDLGQQGLGSRLVECVDAADLGSYEVVKIDTEGCEVEILERLHLEETRAVMLEYHSYKDRDTLLGILRERGFALPDEIPGPRQTGVLKAVRP